MKAPAKMAKANITLRILNQLPFLFHCRRAADCWGGLLRGRAGIAAARVKEIGFRFRA